MITGIAAPANDRLQRTAMDKVPKRWCATNRPVRCSSIRAGRRLRRMF
jgi:hypothetical protein